MSRECRPLSLTRDLTAGLTVMSLSGDVDAEDGVNRNPRNRRHSHPQPHNGDRTTPLGRLTRMITQNSVTMRTLTKRMITYISKDARVASRAITIRISRRTCSRRCRPRRRLQYNRPQRAMRPFEYRRRRPLTLSSTIRGIRRRTRRRCYRKRLAIAARRWKRSRQPLRMITLRRRRRSR